MQGTGHPVGCPVFFCLRLRYTGVMCILRFIMVLVCGLCLATAGYAGVAMPCCDEPEQMQDMPCHDHAQEQKAPAKTGHKPMSVKPCNCLGTMQQAVASEAVPAQAAVLDAGQGMAVPLAIRAAPHSIYHPPKAVS